MKVLIDIDDETLAAAARVLGTSTETDTVNAALRLVAQHREPATVEVPDSVLRFGVGPDIADPSVMAAARR